jgi:hypothetical protein
LGKNKNNGIGTHFIFENRDIRYNVLRAVGYFGGKAVVEDVVVFNSASVTQSDAITKTGLEKAPHFDKLYSSEGATQSRTLTTGEPNYNYLYRLNCGGDEYKDQFGQIWLKDDTTFSRSWATDYKELNPYLASQRVTYDPIRGTKDWSLFGNFRFGRHKLNFSFPVPDGKYRIELYFTEPWHGTGGSEKTDCEGLRIFDVAVNDSVVLNDIDIWAESGHDGALKKVVYATVKGGKLVISFPEVKAGQALISAIAIATTDKNIQSKLSIQSDWSWTDADKNVLEKTTKEMLPEDKNARLSTVYEAEKVILKGNFEKIIVKNKEGIRFGKGINNSIQWTINTGLAQIYALRFNYMNTTGKPVKTHFQIFTSNGVLLRDDEITFSEAPEKWKQISTTTVSFINAGTYRILISGENLMGLSFESLLVQ